MAMAYVCYGLAMVCGGLCLMTHQPVYLIPQFLGLFAGMGIMGCEIYSQITK